MVRAMILAAGQGTRLRPYTESRPKCLVELVGKSLLERQVKVLRGVGITDIAVITGYRAASITLPGLQKFVNPRYANTNMVATLFCAAELMNDDQDLLICYGDIVYERKVLETLLACDEPIALAADLDWQRYWNLRMEAPLDDAETFKMTPEGRVSELGKKPNSLEEIEAQYMGLIKVRADHVDRFREVYENMDREAHYDGKDFDNMYMTSFLQYLIDSGWAVGAALTHNGWLEVDTTKDLDLYHELYAKGELADLCRLEG